MEFFQQLSFIAESDQVEQIHVFFKQLYWLLAFLIAVIIDDVETLMEIVYDERRVLPKHAHALAGRASLRIIRRYVARRYMTYRILRDISARFRHSLYDIWLLVPELRHDVDEVRKELGPVRLLAR